MKKGKKWLERIVIGLPILASVLLFGPWLVNLFGLVNYKPPMSQRTENVVQIDLLEHVNGEFRILHSVTGEEIDAFMTDFLNLDAGKYANDPPLNYGRWTVRLCYADGGYDLLGGMVEFFSQSGESLHTRGMYYLMQEDLDALFEEYLP